MASLSIKVLGTMLNNPNKSFLDLCDHNKIKSFHPNRCIYAVMHVLMASVYFEYQQILTRH